MVTHVFKNKLKVIHGHIRLSLIMDFFKRFFGNDPRKNGYTQLIYCNYCGSDTPFETNCSKKRDQENIKKT